MEADHFDNQCQRGGMGVQAHLTISGGSSPGASTQQASHEQASPWGSAGTYPTRSTALPGLLGKLGPSNLPAVTTAMAGVSTAMARPMLALANSTEALLAGARERTQALLDQAREGSGNLFQAAAAANTARLRQETEGLMRLIGQQRAALQAQLATATGLNRPGATLLGRMGEIARGASLPNLLQALGGGSPATPGVSTVGVTATPRDAQQVLATAAAAARAGAPQTATPAVPVWDLGLPSIDDGEGPNPGMPLVGLPGIQAGGPVPGVNLAASVSGNVGGLAAGASGLGGLIGLPQPTVTLGQPSGGKQVDNGDDEIEVSDVLDIDVDNQGGPLPLPQQPQGASLLQGAIPQFPRQFQWARPQATPAGSK